MQTAIMDPEDDRPDPRFDDNWYSIHYYPTNVAVICRICHTSYTGPTTTEAMNRLILCGLGHVLTGRRFTP